MNDELIAFFQRSITARTEIAQTLTPTIGNASLALLQTMLEGGKVVTWGNAEGVAIAQLVAAQLLTRYSIERPALPAVCLNSNAVLHSATTSYLPSEDGHSRILRSLGSPGDILIMLSLTEAPDSEKSLVDAAHEKGMSVIYCHTHESERTTVMLQENDWDIALPGESKAIALDSALFVGQTFNALIDHHLFGSSL